MHNVEPLYTLVQRCTLRIWPKDSPREYGTGFFVAQNLVLTCAHVVKGAQNRQVPVMVRWENQDYIAEIEQFRSEPYPDLALLKVNNIGNHPCVYLHKELGLGDDLFSYGYTNNYPNGDSATFKYEGSTGEPQALLKFKDGEVRDGLSGGPLLNRRTGGVCGIVKLAREPDMGGRAVPMTTISQEFPKLLDQNAKFHQQDKGNTWYNCLTAQQRQLLNLAPVTSAAEIFILYAEEDEKWLKKLEKHLAVMQKQNFVTTWYKGKVKGGQDIQNADIAHIPHIDIILMLISPDFMDAHYLDGTGVEQALERRKAGTTVIPVLLRFTDWRTSPFGGIQPLPLNGKPVKQWSDDDEAFYEITRNLREIVVNVVKNKGRATTS